MRETPKALVTTSNGKPIEGTRLIAESNGNKTNDETMGNPQCYHLNPMRKHATIGYGEHSETERVLVVYDGLITLKRLKIQSDL
jgi:hypothetical protein